MSPPLYRHRPFWYQRSLPQVAERFSAVLSHDQPPNLRLLPSFTSQDLLPDGIHLTPVAGLHYMLHIFDQTESVLHAATLGTEQQLMSVRESVRHHDDRLAYIENRHGSFEKRADTRVASDAEFDDWMLNRSEEDWLVITGLPRISCSQREWQDAARKQVTDVISLVLHVNRLKMNFEVYYVSNPFRFQTNRQNLYNVQMDSDRSSKRIRDVFSGFFRGRKPVALPPPLKGVSFRNKITPNTKIRISILHQLGSIYKETNPGGMYKVQGFVPRPVLITFPPQNSSGRQRTYNFVQAVTLLPANFSDEHLTRIYQVVSEQQPGNLQSLFIVLKDDDRDRCLELVRQSRAPGQQHHQSQQPPQSQSQPQSSGSGFIFGSFSGPGNGNDLQDPSGSVLENLRDPPPPPPTTDDRAVTGPEDQPGAEKSTSRRSQSPDSREKDQRRERDTHKSKAKDKGKRKDKNKSRSRRKRRRSSSSPDDRSRKRSKKSKRHRRSPSSSSSASSSSSSSDSSDSEDSRSKKTEKTEIRTRDRDDSPDSRKSARSRSRER